MRIAEAMDPVLPGQPGLGLTHVRQAQIVIAKLGRHPRLLVTRKEWLGLPDVDPLAGAFSPPRIDLRDTMEPWKIEGDQANVINGGAFIAKVEDDSGITFGAQ